MCDSEFSFIPNYKKTRKETDSFVSFFYSGIISLQNIYDNYSLFQEQKGNWCIGSDSNVGLSPFEEIKSTSLILKSI